MFKKRTLLNFLGDLQAFQQQMSPSMSESRFVTQHPNDTPPALEDDLYARYMMPDASIDFSFTIYDPS